MKLQSSLIKISEHGKSGLQSTESCQVDTKTADKIELSGDQTPPSAVLVIDTVYEHVSKLTGR